MQGWNVGRWLVLSVVIAAQTTASDPEQHGWTGFAAMGVARGAERLTSSWLPEPTTSPWIDGQAVHGRLFISTHRGIGFELVQSETISATGGAGISAGRREPDNLRLKGLGGVAAAPAAVLTVDWHPLGDAVHAYSSLVASTWGVRRLSLAIGAMVGFPVRGRLNGFLDLSEQLANCSLIAEFFGVTATQAHGSGYREFHPEGGRLQESASVGLVYACSRSWSVSGMVGRTWLRGDAARSPIVAIPAFTNTSLVLKRSF